MGEAVFLRSDNATPPCREACASWAQKEVHKLLILNSDKDRSIRFDNFTYCEVCLLSAYRYA